MGSGGLEGGDDGGAQHGQVDSDAAEHLAGSALDVDEAEEDVVGLDARVPPAQGQAVGPLEGPPGAVGELRFSGPPRSWGPHGFDDLGATGVEGGARRGQEPARRSPLAGQDPEEQVLGAYVDVAQAEGLFPGVVDDPLGTGVEPLEHQRTVLRRPRNCGARPGRRF